MSEQRKLASVQVIKDIQPIPGADAIERLTVQGWYCVGRKNEYQIGQQVVFVEPDAILPFAPWSEFLRDKNKPDKPIRIKTVKLRGQVSQGICFPLDILTKSVYNPVTGFNDIFKYSHIEGDDVTEFLGITKYEPEIPANMAGQVKGGFPSFLKKTDSLRIQSYPEVIEEFKQSNVYATVKLDGTSATFYLKDGVFGVCSRNLDMAPSDNVYWKIAKEHDIENKLKLFGHNVCIQGEIYGQGVQKNKMGAQKLQFAVFDIFDIDKHCYYNFQELKDITKLFGLPMVEVVLDNQPWPFNTVDEVVEFASSFKYGNGSPIEGVVFRPTEERHSRVLNERLAIKAINPQFLLKHGE